MSLDQKADIIHMFRSGNFSIREVAAYAGTNEYATADWLIAIGELRRRAPRMTG